MTKGYSVRRREALKNMLGGVAAASALPLSQVVRAQPTSPAKTDWDVIVIGGGFAGVTAARDASLRGLSTLLLEARDRLGGRTDNALFGGHKIEVGGTWIGWGQPHVWSERMRYGLPIAESAAAGAEEYIWIDGGKRVRGTPDEYWSMMTPAYDAFYAPAREAMPRPYDPLRVDGIERLDRISAAQAIDALQLSPVQRRLLHSFAAINGHNHSSRSSYLDQLRWNALAGFSNDFMWDNLGRYRLADGTETLIARMIADGRAEVRLGEPVIRVTQTPAGVEVATAAATYRGRAAVVALPLNVLANVDFRPGLSPAKLNASRRRHTGAGTKVYAKLAGRTPTFFANGPQELPLNFLWTEYQDVESQLVVGFGSSRELLDISKIDAVRQAIRTYVPDADVAEIHGHDWTADPYSLGTWCMYPPGLLTSSLPQLQKPESNLFFATSDIASGWRGFIDGAIESGAAAALAVAHHVKGGRN